MVGFRRSAGTALIVFGVVGVALCLGLLGLVFLAAPAEMSAGKQVSESMILLMVGAWSAGFVLAGRVLRRR